MKAPPCQKILDEQGFLVIGSWLPKEIGYVMEGAIGGADYLDVPGPLVVVGLSTAEEFQAQYDRYLAPTSDPPVADPEYFFYRVIAE